MTADAPVRSTGYTVDVPSGQQIVNWYTDLSNEQVPELRWPLSVLVYDRMRKDSQVASMLRAVNYPIRRTPWRLDPAGARDEVVQFVADDLGLPIVGEPARPVVRSRNRFSWPEHLRHALTSLPFGHAFFEQEAPIGPDGLAHLKRLAFRPQTSITAVNVARDGGLISIQQEYTAPPIPVSRLVAYAYEREGGNWLGSSILRPAYQPWLLKDRLARVDTMKHERNGLGIPVYYGPEKPTDPKADRDAGLELTSSMRAGDNAGTALPWGSKVELLSVMGTLPDALPSIRYYDERIAVTVLGHVFNLGQQTGTGSYALGVTFVDVFNQSLQTVAMDLADVANAHIVEDLVDWNFGETEPAPRLVFDEIGSQQRLTALGIKALMDAGLILPDRSLEEWVRQTSGMPPKDPLPFTPSQGGTA